MSVVVVTIPAPRASLVGTRRVEAEWESMAEGDLATKQDLQVLERTLKAELRAEFMSAMNDQTRTLIVAMGTMMLTVSGLAFAAARLV